MIGATARGTVSVTTVGITGRNLSVERKYRFIWTRVDGHLYYTDLRSAAVRVEPQKGT